MEDNGTFSYDPLLRALSYLDVPQGEHRFRALDEAYLSRLQDQVALVLKKKGRDGAAEFRKKFPELGALLLQKLSGGDLAAVEELRRLVQQYDRASVLTGGDSEVSPWVRVGTEATQQVPPLRFIWGQSLREGLTIVSGREKSGKTLFFLALSYSWSLGVPFLGQDCPKLRVAWFQEMGSQDFRRYSEEVRVGHGFPSDGCEFMACFPRGLDLTKPEQQRLWIDHVVGLSPRPEVVIVDSLAGLHSAPEKSSEEVRKFTRGFLVPLKEALGEGSAVIGLHHQAKHGDGLSARGSTEFGAATDANAFFVATVAGEGPDSAPVEFVAGGGRGIGSGGRVAFQTTHARQDGQSLTKVHLAEEDAIEAARERSEASKRRSKPIEDSKRSVYEHVRTLGPLEKGEMIRAFSETEITETRITKSLTALRAEGHLRLRGREWSAVNPEVAYGRLLRISST